MVVRIFLLMLFINCITVVNSQDNDTIINEKAYFIKAHEMAANDFNDSLLQQYIVLYPKGDFIKKAHLSIDVCAWQNARFKNTRESYEMYLNEFPKGEAITLAKQILLTLSDSTKQK